MPLPDVLGDASAVVEWTGGLVAKLCATAVLGAGGRVRPAVGTAAPVAGLPATRMKRTAARLLAPRLIGREGRVRGSGSRDLPRCPLLSPSSDRCPPCWADSRSRLSLALGGKAGLRPTATRPTRMKAGTDSGV